MSDITVKLRSALCQTYECDRIGYEAADEIDRLRAELSRANEQLEAARDQHGYLVSAAAFDEVCEERDRYRAWHDAVMAQPTRFFPVDDYTSIALIVRPQPLEVKP